MWKGHLHELHLLLQEQPGRTLRHVHPDTGILRNYKSGI